MPTYSPTKLPKPDKPRKPKKPRLHPDVNPKPKLPPPPKGWRGNWLTDPNLNPKLWETRKTGYGRYIAKKKLPGLPKSVTPTPPPGPYDRYKTTAPWAIPTLEQMDRDTENERAYGLKVQQWLSSTLGPIQAAHQQAASTYQNQIAALPPAGTVQIPPVAAMSPGGTTIGSPQAWQTEASRTAAGTHLGAMQGSSAIQRFLAEAGIGNLRQGLETNLAHTLLRLGEQRKKEKMEYISKLDQFVSSSEAEAKQEKAELIARTTNDWYDFVAQLTNAGVRLTDINMDNIQQQFENQNPQGSGGVFVPGAQKPDPVPGVKWVREPTGWRGVTVSQPGGRAGSKPTGLIGPIDPGTRVPAGYVKVRSGGKIYWRAKGTGAAGGGAGGGKPLSPEQARIQTERAAEIWEGKPGNTFSGTAPVRGLSSSTVTRFTAADGTIPPGTDGNRRQYIQHVRYWRLAERLESFMSPTRAAKVMAGMIGRANYNRYANWANNNQRNDDYSMRAAKRRRHI